MADQNFTTAIQPFVLLAKGAGPAAAADIITRATEHPNCFVFSELLEVPNIQRLKDHEEYSKYYNLLRLFAYGSYQTYLHPPQPLPLPLLSPLQLHKLKQLTLITLSSSPTPTSHPTSIANSLSYPTLLTTLSIPTTRELEDVVISAIYSGLLNAKLDTASQRIEVSSTSGRDVAPEEIPGMIEVLKEWEGRCESVLGDIDEQVREIQRMARERKKEREEYEKEVKEKRDALMWKKGGEGGPGSQQAGGAGAAGAVVGAVGVPAAGASQGKGKRVASEGEDAMAGYDDVMDIDDEGGSQSTQGLGSGIFSALGGGRKRKGLKVANKRRS